MIVWHFLITFFVIQRNTVIFIIMIVSKIIYWYLKYNLVFNLVSFQKYTFLLVSTRYQIEKIETKEYFVRYFTFNNIISLLSITKYKKNH